MRFIPGSIALTLFGWTPGLREIVGGHVLPCGCLVGIYETWTDGWVEILDGVCENCESRHQVNRVLHLTPREYAAEVVHMAGGPQALQPRR